MRRRWAAVDVRAAARRRRSSAWNSRRSAVRLSSRQRWQRRRLEGSWRWRMGDTLDALREHDERPSRRRSTTRTSADVSTGSATYVYCLVARAKRPRLTGVPAGLPGTGPVRLLDVDPGRYLVVADAPLSRYGEKAIQRGLSDLAWISRA